jgi:hypothetical protein
VNASTTTYPNGVASSQRFSANLNFRMALRRGQIRSATRLRAARAPPRGNIGRRCGESCKTDGQTGALDILLYHSWLTAQPANGSGNHEMRFLTEFLLASNITPVAADWRPPPSEVRVNCRLPRPPFPSSPLALAPDSGSFRVFSRVWRAKFSPPLHPLASISKSSLVTRHSSLVTCHPRAVPSVSRTGE